MSELPYTPKNEHVTVVVAARTSEEPLIAIHSTVLLRAEKHETETFEHAAQRIAPSTKVDYALPQPPTEQNAGTTRGYLMLTSKDTYSHENGVFYVNILAAEAIAENLEILTEADRHFLRSAIQRLRH